jgi:hypothetical protein
MAKSPVAATPLVSNEQWLVVVGHAFGEGLSAVGPFPNEDSALRWMDDRGGAEYAFLMTCLAPETTILDRLGYPLHIDDAARS